MVDASAPTPDKVHAAGKGLWKITRV